MFFVRTPPRPWEQPLLTAVKSPKIRRHPVSQQIQITRRARFKTTPPPTTPKGSGKARKARSPRDQLLEQTTPWARLPTRLGGIKHLDPYNAFRTHRVREAELVSFSAWSLKMKQPASPSEKRQPGTRTAQRKWRSFPKRERSSTPRSRSRSMKPLRRKGATSKPTCTPTVTIGALE